MAKRKYPTIKCTDCGGKAKAPNSRTKYCTFCRLARGAQWHDGRISKCTCGRDFIDWNGGARMCGRCFASFAPAGGREAGEGPCGMCGADVPTFHDRLQVCYPCLDLPANFADLRKIVVRRYREGVVS